MMYNVIIIYLCLLPLVLNFSLTDLWAFYVWRILVFIHVISIEIFPFSFASVSSVKYGCFYWLCKSDFMLKHAMNKVPISAWHMVDAQYRILLLLSSIRFVIQTLWIWLLGHSLSSVSSVGSPTTRTALSKQRAQSPACSVTYQISWPSEGWL